VLPQRSQAVTHSVKEKADATAREECNHIDAVALPEGEQHEPWAMPNMTGSEEIDRTMQQVPKEHYQFETYTGFDRWSSYYYQVREIVSLAPASMLEIGSGDGFLKRFIEGATEISYRSLDIAADLRPDIIGSAESIPLRDGAVDIVVACEVLEHLPFDKFEKTLREMGRVSRGHVLISLPHYGPRVKASLKLPRMKELRLAMKVGFPQKHVFHGEHYWEIGKRGYSLSKVRGILKAIFTIEKDFIPWESQYHHFFLLRK
jgi:Methyltransferase domain